MNWVMQFIGVDWLTALTDLVEIGVLAVVFYFVINLFRGTRGEEIMWGFVLAVGGLLLVTRVLPLQELNWMLQRLAGYVVIAGIVVFHPEIRRALAEIGKTHVPGEVEVTRETLDAVEDAVQRLAKEKIGALIAIERENTLQSLQSSGRLLDAEVSADLLCTIFYPGTALHDGGVVVSKNRIVRAGCMFPMTTSRGDVEQNVKGGRRVSIGRLGMRHRAAVGLTEDTDAVVVVVSEQTGAIRVATDRKLTDVLTGDELHKTLESLFSARVNNGNEGRGTWFARWWTRANSSMAGEATTGARAVEGQASAPADAPAPAQAQAQAPAAPADASETEGGRS
ncbi:MAG: diadenylate cyclase [Kiritimatiellae bacterium]|nr:diadenylate cyclase [Kiritimatiellia bacterium]